MDIDFNISQIHDYSFFVNSIAEEISVSFNQIQSFFSETQTAYESTKVKLQETETIVLDLSKQVNFIKNLIVKKLEKMPISKECLENPSMPNYSQDKFVAEKQKVVYENDCQEIQKANDKIKTDNETNNKIVQELQELNQTCEKLLQKLEMMISRCNAIKGLINESQSNFLVKKNECDFDIKKTLNLINQTCEALNNTYAKATPLVEENRHSRVYGNLHKVFKLKISKNQEAVFEDNSDLLIKENIVEIENNKNKKIIQIKSKKIEDLKNEINLLSLSIGDIVKIPSYNLFNLGGDKLSEEMKEIGFKNSTDNGYEILDDGTIEWVKYE